MKKIKRIICFCFLHIILTCEYGHAFQTTGPSWIGGIMYWYQDDQAAQMFKDSNYAASLTWYNQGGAKFRFERAGFTLANPLNHNDMVNTFGGVSLGAGSDTLAYTRCRWNLGIFIECDIVRNMDVIWSQSPTYYSFDIESVSLHEFGHALGLAHSADTGAVMKPLIGYGEVKRNLSQDDINVLTK